MCGNGGGWLGGQGAPGSVGTSGFGLVCVQHRHQASRRTSGHVGCSSHWVSVPLRTPGKAVRRGAAGRFHVALKGTLGPRTQVAQRQLWTQHRELWSHQGRAVMAKAPVQRWGSPLSGRVSGGGSAAAPRALLQLRGPCSWADRGSRGRTGGAAPLGPQNKSPQGPSGSFFSAGLR